MKTKCKITRTSSLLPLRLALLVAFIAAGVSGQVLTCPANNPPPGLDFRGQTITAGNFAYRNLTNANFAGATLVAPFFQFANLTNANFQGAVFVNDNSNPAMAADFSFADLQGACFIGAKFNGLTYFTSARLTCADFSQTDLSNQNAIFGESPLNFDRNKTTCRLAFRSSKMDCEFFGDWRYLDLSGADIRACSNQFAGQDFTSAKLSSVDLRGANLDAVNFSNADLSQAVLDQASLRGANLSKAILLGAHLNLANLTGASLYGASLSNSTPTGVSNAASLRQAHLKNVNLSYAQLSGVDFTFANFYGDIPAAPCRTVAPPDKCTGSSSSPNYEGFTCSCASGHGAIMTQTKFSGAYLYGVDFTDVKGQGVNFSDAILTGANLSGAVITSDPQSGSASTFFRTFLQGTELSGTRMEDSPNLSNAFVDFSRSGNFIFILLDGANHNQFTCQNCWPPTGTDVCVWVNYLTPTTVPSGGTRLTCPNLSVGDCGPAEADGSNPKWKSTITDLALPPTGVPPAWYEQNSTYIKAPDNLNAVCNGRGSESAIVLW